MKDKNLWLVLLLAILVYGANLGGTSIYVLDEAKNAGCAAEMYASNNWFVPTFNGEWRTDKPPLHYFFMWIGIKAIGVTPFAVRFFSMLFGVLTVLSTYLFTKNVLGKRTGFYAALILIASLQLAIQFHLAVPDPYLLFFMTTGLYLLYSGIELKHKKSVYISYALFSFAFLAKGLIAIVLPGCIILLYLFFHRKKLRKSIRKLQLEVGVLLFLIISLPWFIFNGLQTDWEWARQYFIVHHFNRYTTTFEGHRSFFLAGFVYLLLSLVPFSVFAPQAILYGWINRADPLFRFLLISILVIALFFSFSRTILPSYPAPAAPFLAILIAYYLKNVMVMRKQVTNGVLVSMVFYFLLTLGIPIALYFILKNENLPTAPAIYFIVLPLGGLVSLYLLWKKNLKLMIMATVSTWVITSLIFFNVAWPQIDQVNPVTLGNQIVKGHTIAYFKSMNPAFVFTNGAPVPELKSRTEVINFLKGPKNILITDEPTAQMLATQFNSCILLQQKNLFESGVTVLVRGENQLPTGCPD